MIPLILDTCILQYAISKITKKEYSNYIYNLLNTGHKLVFSEITLYELLQGVTKTKEQELLSYISQFIRYPIDEHILATAAQLHTLYTIEKIPLNQISDGDKIIAATAVLNNYPIVTANLHDFPRPFFVEKERKLIIYHYKNIPRMIPTYTLEPDLDVLNFRFANRPK